jgi:hypothetical protein
VVFGVRIAGDAGLALFAGIAIAGGDAQPVAGLLCEYCSGTMPINATEQYVYRRRAKRAPAGHMLVG